MGKYFRTEKGYEKRTHWSEIKEIILVDNLTSENYDNGNIPPCNFIPGHSYNVTLNGTIYKGLICYSNNDYNIIDGGRLYPFYITDKGGDNLYIDTSSDTPFTITISENIIVYHKLDPKYIPTDDILVQSNWNDNDESSKAFILNKPPVIQNEDGDVCIGSLDDIENSEKLITEKNFYEPKKHLVVRDEIDGYNYIISTRNGNIASYIQTRFIEITAMPTKTIYADHEEFNPDGMILTAIGMDGSTREITNYTYDVVTTSNANNFVISYTEMGITHTVTISLDLHDFSLIDFEYIITSDGKYELTAWKGTYNGEPSTRIIVPDSELIIV